MRGITSRGTRPCLHCTSTPGTFLPPIRRAILPPSRKKITPADAFIILLPGVLTAAFVLDITAKHRRSQEWERQIDAVEKETEALRARQLKAWERLQHRSIRHGLAQQRRMMSTVTQSLPVEVEDDLDPLDLEDRIKAADRGAEKMERPEQTEDHVRAQARYERLVATRLALSMMLELRVGRSAIYTSRVKTDPNAPTMDYIVRELEKVVYMIRAMRIENVPYNVQMPPDFEQRKQELGHRVFEVTQAYRDNNMHLPDFVMNYARLVGEYKMGPPMRTYVRMMRALSTTQSCSHYAKMVEDAIWHAHQPLDNYAISNILYRHGSDFESSRYTEFLERLSRSDGFPLPAQRWFRTQVNGLHIYIPKSRNPHLLPSLIRASLCNQQQSIAEAQATVFFHRLRGDPDHDPIHKLYVVTCFLQSYGSWGSWDIGKRWLQTAVTWAQEFLQIGDAVLGRIVLRMLDFCVACGHRDAYDCIMTAAITNNLRIPEIDPRKRGWVTERMQHIRLDWISKVKAIRPNHSWRKVQPQDVNKFQEALKGVFDEEQDLPMSKPFHPADATFQESSSPLSYNPLVAAQRLQEAKAQRALGVQAFLRESHATGEAEVDLSSWKAEDQDASEGEAIDRLLTAQQAVHPAVARQKTAAHKIAEHAITGQKTTEQRMVGDESATDQAITDRHCEPHTSPFFAPATVEHVTSPGSLRNSYLNSTDDTCADREKKSVEQTSATDLKAAQAQTEEVRQLRLALAEAKRKLRQFEKRSVKESQQGDNNNDYATIAG